MCVGGGGHVCVHVCVHVCGHVCVHTYICGHVCVHVCMHACRYNMYKHLYTSVCHVLFSFTIVSVIVLVLDFWIRLH